MCVCVCVCVCVREREREGGGGGLEPFELGMVMVVAGVVGRGDIPMVVKIYFPK